MKTNQAIKLSGRTRMTAIIPTLLARAAVLLGALFLAGGLSAAQVAWDADTGTSGAQDGGGTWSVGANNWWDGGANVLWPNTTSDIAVIGAGNGGGSNINTVGSINLNRLVLNPPLSNSYTIFGGTLNFGGTTPTITNAGTAVTISNNITGSAGLTVVGNRGTTVIQGPGPNSFTGGLNLRSGTLLARDTVTVLGGNGTGAVMLGDTSSSASAVLRIGNSLAITNPITVQGGSSGVAQIDNFGNYSPTFYGAVTLNKDLTIRNVWSSGSSRRPAFVGNIGGAGGIVISSQRADGYVHLLGNNSFSGGVAVQSGRLLLENSTALGSSSSVLTLAGGARLDAQTPVMIANANPQRWLGDFIYVGSADLNLGTGNVTLGANTAISYSTAGRTLTIGGGISGTGFGLALSTQLAGGTLQLNGVNTYTGNTTVNLGATLALGASASLSNSSEIFLASGGTFDVSALGSGFNLGSGSILGGSGSVNGSVNQASGATLNPGGRAAAGTLTITGNANLNQGGKLWFDLSNDPISGVNDQVTVGTLNCVGTNTVSLNPTTNDFGAGSYTLVNYTSLTAGDTNYFQPDTAASQSRRTFSFDSSTFGQIKLNVGGSPLATLVWAGDGSANTWNYNAANNWTNGVVRDVFMQLDNVIFDDTGSASPVVSLVGALTPASITFRNQSQNYVLGGSGNLAGLGGLTLQGTGTVTLSNSAANTFTGPINVNNGALILASANGLGNAAYCRMSEATNSYLGLTGGLSFNPVPLQFGGRTGTSVSAHLVNVSGNNTWPGSITMNSGGGFYGIRSDSGKLTISGNIALINSLGNDRALTLDGSADGEISGRIGNSTSTTATHATASVFKQGGGTWTITSTNYYGGSTTVSAGTLVINGSIIGSGVTVNSGTLGGNGVITAPVTVNSGGNLAPGTSIGTLKVVGNVVLNGATTMEIARNGAALTNDLVADINALSLGGSLVVLNTGSSALQAGDTFKLFAAASYAGGFTNLSLPSGYTFNTNNLAINGTIQVATVVPTIPTTPTNLTFSVSGSPVSSINLSWPSNYLGWSLQMQTNSLGVGLSTNWVTIPGSELVTSTNMPIITTNGAVFFQMKYVP